MQQFYLILQPLRSEALGQIHSLLKSAIVIVRFTTFAHKRAK